MEYQFERIRSDYKDYASGRVLYNARGAATFPVRLTSEIIQRCFSELAARGNTGPYTLYDPCCGTAYLLTVAGLLHGNRLRAVYGSDIDSDKLSVAALNLSLLTDEGMRKREAQLQELFAAYGKASHREALTSLHRLDERRLASAISELHTFQADITAAESLPAFPHGIDIVMTDLPYGTLAEWRGGSTAPFEAMLDRLYGVLNEQAMIAIIADKNQKLRHDRFRRLQHVKAGKRHIALFEPIRD